mgnify:CR=1 FL=1
MAGALLATWLLLPAPSHALPIAHTPVPGGVGPMTRATLMLNTAEAAGLTVELPYPPQPIG